MREIFAKGAANLPVNKQNPCLHMMVYLFSSYALLGFEEQVFSHVNLQRVGPDGESIAGVYIRLADPYVCVRSDFCFCVK